MIRVAALIIGIDGWERYTLPLIESLREHEPAARVFVIDNASETPYRMPAEIEEEEAYGQIYLPKHSGSVHLTRSNERLSYSKSINLAAKQANYMASVTTSLVDWYIVLSNDVLCTGPFVDMLTSLPNDCIAGPHMAENHGVRYLEGWCVCVPRHIWDALNGWDENFIVSSWEDVDFSMSAMKAGYRMAHVVDMPFQHLDQKQRFNLIPDYWSSERHNLDYFMEKHELKMVTP